MQWKTFVLYCHIKPSDKDSLLEISDSVNKILEDEQGLLVFFVDTGLADLLRMIHPIKRELSRSDAKQEKQRLKDDLRQRSGDLSKGESLGKSLEEGFGAGVRVLTALDLVDIFGEMSAVENLKKFLTGMRDEIRYDTPKFIESIVRLRMIGSRVPVLRLDRDVLIPPSLIQFDKNKLALAIRQIRDAVVEHHDRTQVLATIISANYETPNDSNDDVMAWNRGFATRILPSLLLPDADAAKKHLENPELITDWGGEMQCYFRCDLTKQFLDDLWEWGAPKTAVISGALLYMNDAVVLNVPPFSNFSQMVMWIDDHLRYVLHREMGDFCHQTQVSYKTGNPLHVFYEDVNISKYRAVEKYLLYSVQTYLPSLLWGSFFDYWLCPRALLKRREEDVEADDLQQWLKERREGHPGILVTAVLEARAGCLPDEGKLRENLKNAANIRLRVLRKVWGDLKHNGSHSLASAWVHDKFPDSLKAELLNPSDKDKKLPKISSMLPGNVEDFQDGLRDGFNDLLDDTCRYVKWVFEWPHVVSVIRSIPQGEFRSDLEWAAPMHR